MVNNNININSERLCNWVLNDALPLWASVGVDPRFGNFVERLTMDGEPLLGYPRRAMVQARQIYVFAHAALLGLFPAGRDIAINATEHLIKNYYAVDGAPGWVFSIDRNCQVVDRKRDFYTYAFVLFGLAWAYKLKPDQRIINTAMQTIKYLDDYFASPHGGYYTSLPAMPAQRHQNPHMHYFEALMAWNDVTGDPFFLKRTTELYQLMTTRFFQPLRGILPEYYDDSWTPKKGEFGRICEPGHHYEWSWLLRAYANRVGKTDEVIAKLLKSFADKNGLDSSGLIVDELLDDGSINRSSRRCWPHTEAIKAEVAAYEIGDDGAPMRASITIDQLFNYFLGRPIIGGWTDHIDAKCQPLVDFMPASTLYHVFCCMAEARRVWGGTWRSRVL